MSEIKPGCAGDKYVPYEARSGGESIVFFTRDLSAEGLRKIYERVNGSIDGRVAVKLHTGEQHGPHILPSDWANSLLKNKKHNKKKKKNNNTNVKKS